MTTLTPGSLHKSLPEAAVGNAKIVHDTPDMLTRLRAARDNQPLNAERYTRLLIGGECWMTDAEFECWTNATFLRAARGDILIAGLGLGLIVRPIMDLETVSTITILEVNPDVISLIEPTLSHSKVNIIQADVFFYQPPKRAFDQIYFDIWKDVPNEDYRDEIKALKKQYRPALKKGGIMTAWCEKNIRGGRA